MVVFDNLAHILRSTLLAASAEKNHNEWKILGEQTRGRFIVSWITEENNKAVETNIASFISSTNELTVLNRQKGKVNIVQASVDESLTLLSYVVKEDCSGNPYRHYIVSVGDGNEIDSPAPLLQMERRFQIMTTFLNSIKDIRLLIMIHTETVLLYHLKLEDNDIVVIRSETVTKAFIWAQWDFLNQSLYFIHFRKTTVYEDESEKQEMVPTLSCFRFHSDLPHETVLNIPLNLPVLSKGSAYSSGLYEDDCVPLRVHDCALDLLVISSKDGVVCICHHYLYQPVKPPGIVNKSPADDTMTVHFAYSVTLLHHGCVIHCTLPGVPWVKAKTLRPGFTLLGSQYLLVHGPGVFTHLLDVGLAHEPYCHIILPEVIEAVPRRDARLVAIQDDFTESSSTHEDALGPAVMIDLLTLDLLEVEVTPNDLLNGFRNITCDSNRLAILHYFLVHLNDVNLIEDVLDIIATTPNEINVTHLLQEILVGGAYSIAQRNLPSDAANLLSLLPMTCLHPSGKSEVKVNTQTVTLTQEILWNTAMMLLSPQQRLVPYRTDMWTKLWDQLAKLSEVPRFKHCIVAEKLGVSLLCYQPEALSHCSTPMSPAPGFVPTCSYMDMAGLGQLGGNRKSSGHQLPFHEMDSCTASKQEHVISVNMRELNMYLMKNSSREAPMHVHAMTTRYVTAQLEMSKQLCYLLTRVSGLQELSQVEKGFPLISNLDEYHGQLLFTLLQRFHHAAQLLAYPLPQGFSSFFCYLGFTVLPFPLFLQYLRSNVFLLQIDVMKEILKETEDTKDGVEKKLRLLQTLPRSRAKRLLNTWSHPMSLMLRAREHALNVLSGVQTARLKPPQTRRYTHASRGLAAFPSGDRISPLDTFLDLLTAKASLTELDLTLLFEATVSSTEDFI